MRLSFPFFPLNFSFRPTRPLVASWLFVASLLPFSIGVVLPFFDVGNQLGRRSCGFSSNKGDPLGPPYIFLSNIFCFSTTTGTLLTLPRDVIFGLFRRLPVDPFFFYRSPRRFFLLDIFPDYPPPCLYSFQWYSICSVSGPIPFFSAREFSFFFPYASCGGRLFLLIYPQLSKRF